MKDINELENTIGYIFNNKDYLYEALTHSSLGKRTKSNKAYSNERLEFVGDRVLGLVMADLLFAFYPHEPEGHLSIRFTNLVCKKILVEVAHEINLIEYIHVGDKEEIGSSTQADACEALIAAIYLDSGLNTASQFIKKYWNKRLDSKLLKDSKTYLQEWSQKNGRPIPEYTVISIKGTDHNPMFETSVLVKDFEPVIGCGTSKKRSQSEAARIFIKTYKIDLD